MEKPAYEKIIIGPMMTICEGIIGGNAKESAKILKQSTGNSYYNSLKGLYTRVDYFTQDIFHLVFYKQPQKVCLYYLSMVR
jgi:hypothetical protein